MGKTLKKTYDGLDAVVHVRLDAALFEFDAADELSQFIFLHNERDLLFVVRRLRFRFGRSGGLGVIGRHACTAATRS